MTVDRSGLGTLQLLIKRVYNIEDKDWKEEKINELAEDFDSYYNSGKYNLYSDTYKWLSSIQDDGKLDYIDHRFEQIEEKLVLISSKNIKEFHKLSDYVILEALRSTNYNSIKDIETRSLKTLQETKELAKMVQDDRKNTSVQAVTVISIFTGIAMAFFGGFSMLSGALTSLKHNGDYIHLAIISLITGFVMFNTIYALICAAGRLSGSSLTSKDHESCLDCKNNIDSCNEKKWHKRSSKFSRKYPYAFAINLIILILIVVFILLDLITTYLPA